MFRQRLNPIEPPWYATRMPGGVGGAAPRGAPLSRSIRFTGNAGEAPELPAAKGAHASLDPYIVYDNGLYHARDEVGMNPLYDHTGSVVGWLSNAGRVMDLRGRGLFWITGTGLIYDYHGHHRGWWNDGHWRGRDGGVVVWTRGARNLGVMPPLPRVPPVPPVPSVEQIRPIPAIPPLRPLNAMAWSQDRWWI